MKDDLSAVSPEARALGQRLDAHHPAAEQVDTGTCARCGVPTMHPESEGMKHWPTEGELSRGEKWLEENQQ